MEPWLAEETWRGCFGRWVVYCVGLVGWWWWVVVQAGECMCSGDAARERLRERPLIFALRAPKKESSAEGEVGEREYVDVGDCSMSGEWVPEDCDFWELLVAVRMGAGGWKLS